MSNNEIEITLTGEPHQIRWAYTYQGTQPTLCSWIAASPLFYFDYDLADEEMFGEDYLVPDERYQADAQKRYYKLLS